ncbi:MAG: glycine C-acetyltransferase [Candidatus Pacebacteria bacterium]|nr:glycine C-acetyltransferase [Candidatus Paceibacterota bacterium]
MTSRQALSCFQEELNAIRDAGLYKNERVLSSPQGRHVTIQDGRTLLNFCANNYLGLANDPRIIQAARLSYDRWGYGLSSVRFICGTQEPHRQLEEKLAAFLGGEAAILYSSCFDANGGLFETLLGPEDVVISDELNHASIIDGIRLCKARRLRYRNRDVSDLEAKLVEAAGARVRLIATDGVFSMDGTMAPLSAICDLADRYDALVMVDDSHATGFIGARGRGTPERCGVDERVDIITSTLGKALGGASGGFTVARKPIVDLLRQRSRPYLFSNTLAPAMVAASLKALEILEESAELRERLQRNTEYFRAGMREHTFSIPEGTHPIVPIMLGDATLAVDMAKRLLDEGIYVVAFSYPVVPEGKARIRVQISAAHTTRDLDRAVNAFAKVRDELA